MSLSPTEARKIEVDWKKAASTPEADIVHHARVDETHVSDRAWRKLVSANRITLVPPARVDVRAIRTMLALSQAEFAGRFGFTPSAVRQWEQGRRQPHGPARVLLTVIAKEPAAVDRALAIA